MKSSEYDFEEIAPYPDHKINSALRRIVKDPMFHKVANFVFPEKSIKEVTAVIGNIHSAADFQVKFMHKAVRRIVETLKC